MVDYLIVGAGFAGSVLAQRLAQDAGKKVLLIDKRPHIAGNAYDCHDTAGILIHQYGPHIFHTNSQVVFEYLSRFTQWRSYEHRVLAWVDGKHVPIPINLDTINTLYNLNLDSTQAQRWLETRVEKRHTIKTAEDAVVSKIGRELYEKFFRGYTRKQWGLDPSELDAAVTARIPTRTNHDDRYFTDQYQAMPAQGYTRLFENMLDHPNITLELDTDFHQVKHSIAYRNLIYSGPADEYFGYRFGKLPYRSLEFRSETHDKPIYQQAPIINYPNDFDYTRVTEYKYLTGQQHAKTSIMIEYPKSEGDPFYPIPRPENAALYKRYQTLMDTEQNVHFVGRLGTYRYYNMDQVVAQALHLYSKLKHS